MLNISLIPTSHDRLPKVSPPSPSPGNPVQDGWWQDLWTKHPQLWLGVALALLSFLVHYMLTLELDQRHAFDRLNVLFDSDTSWYLLGFADGASGLKSWGGRGFVHPNVDNFINPPVRILAQIVQWLWPGSPEAPLVRRQIALLVAPLLAGFKSGLVFFTILALGYSLRAALIITFLGMVSFSGLLFGAIPESYPLSGFALAALFYLTALSCRQGKLAYPWAWLLVGILLFGFTVTNLVPYLMILTLLHYRQHNNIRRSLLPSLKLGTTVVTINAVLALSLSAFYGAMHTIKPQKPGQFEEVRFQISRTLHDFPAALVHTFLPPPPQSIMVDADVLVSVSGNTASAHGDPTDAAIFSYRRMHLPPIQLVGMLIILGIGLVGGLRAKGARRNIFQAAALVLLFNWALHVFFGKEFFLYSQHWQIPLLLILAGWYELPGLGARVAARVLTALILVTAINDLVVLHTIFTRLPV